jgi:crotonobetainyl-CoA:carnitine CoA-transferase CaiB-like acyl-CoA transferase
LADLGAEVIKISRPRRHDALAAAATEQRKHQLTLNAGKEARPDLRAPPAVGVVRRFVATADVVVENFRPGSCAVSA